MDKFLLQALRSRRASIRREWTTLLRAEPVTTPLGHPDTLAHLIDRTLDELYDRLGRRKAHPPGPIGHSYDAVRRECPCGRNPLLAYFLAGERALLEALVQAQTDKPEPAARRQEDVVELGASLRSLAQRDVAAFCSVCLHRHDPAPATRPEANTP